MLQRIFQVRLRQYNDKQKLPTLADFANQHHDSELADT
jgi:hypothetical protein